MGVKAALTVDEAAAWLDPPITSDALAGFIAAAPDPDGKLAPVGTRRTGRAGRPAQTYSAGELMRLHAAVAPWL
jgi:hypothetical protein